MKHFILTALTAASMLSSQAQTATTAAYTIQLGNFAPTVKQADFEAIRSYAYVHKHNATVFIGGFVTEEAAQPILDKVKTKGYDDAVIVVQDLKKAATVYVIQLATYNAGEPIAWKTYAKAGSLYVQPNGNQVRIMHGAFDDINDARVQLNTIKSLGFEDAFVKTVKDITLSKVTTFETDGFAISDAVAEVGIKTVIPKQPTEIPTEEAFVPNSLSNTKRRSVIKLQEALKAFGTFSGDLDGKYGKMTANAFEKALADNRRLKMYNEMSQKNEGFGGWEDVRLLMTITRDLNIDENAQAIVPDLLNNLPTDALDAKEASAAFDWHVSVWQKMEKWSVGSAYNTQIYTALKIAYYQSLAHLETEFAKQNIKGEAATALGLSVIRTLIGEDLAKF